MSDDIDKYSKGGVYVYQIPGGIAAISDQHVVTIPIAGTPEMVVMSEEERISTIDYFTQRSLKKPTKLNGKPLIPGA